MNQKVETPEKQKVDELKVSYTELTKKVFILSQMNVRQFLGTRPEGDPRVDYLTQVEGFKNLANAQLSALIEALSDMLGKKSGVLLRKFEQAMNQEVSRMEEALGVTGWKEDGTPILDLQAHLAKTQGWPR